MNEVEELLQQKLERLEAGESLEACLAGLPEDEAELLKVAAMLRQLPYPARDAQTVAAQRAHLLTLASKEKNMEANSSSPLTKKLQGLFSGWLRPLTAFPGAVAIILIGVLLLGVWLAISRLPPKDSISQYPPAEGQVTVAEQAQATSEIAAVPDSTPADTSTSAPAAVPETTKPAPYLGFVPAVISPWVFNPHQATIKSAQGVVEVQQADGTWAAAGTGFFLSAGQRLRTSDLSSATLIFYDGSEATLEANTEVSIDELDAGTGGEPRIIVLTQWAGETAHNVAHREEAASRYEVRTPNGTGEARGTAFHVLVTPSLLTFFSVDDGAVAVTNVNVTIIVVAGVVGAARPPAADGQPYIKE